MNLLFRIATSVFYATSWYYVIIATLLTDTHNYVVNNNTTHATDIIVMDVTEYGVIADGKHDDTRAMQYMLDVIVMTKRRRVEAFPLGDSIYENTTVVLFIPEGYVVITGPLSIRSNNVILRIDGRLQAWDITNNDTILNGTLWPYIEPLPTYGNSRDGQLHYQYQPFIYITYVKNVRITGVGTIDGTGHSWWNIISAKNESLLLRAGRPNLVQIINSSYVEIDSVTFQDSPFWTIHPVLSHFIHIHHINITAPLYAPNVDGIDPEYVVG
jgi:polygalacturonase